MQNPDSVIVTADQNPAFFGVLRELPIGAEGTVTLHYRKKEQSAESAVLTADAYVPEGYEIDKEATDSPPQTVGIGESMMTPTAMQVRKKGK